MNLDPREIEGIVVRALDEDLPDITSTAIFSPSDRGSAFFLMRADGILCGLPFAEAVFRELDDTAQFRPLRSEGDAVKRDDVVAEVDASVLALLSGERTALNLMQRASGIATLTRRYVETVQGTAAKIYDTRKTAPGLRALDKYAVKIGGGENLRIGLYDMFLIKNNHIDRAGSVTAAIDAVRASGKKAPLMVEVRDFEELAEAAAKNPDFILLDNMSPEDLRKAVAAVGGRVKLEASGGITLENLRKVAETGVDRISIGALTHSVKALDISLRMR